ncbi:RluA family pseudouridine synthase [Pelagicoccus sp. SDUM812002]|uniref:RluA family pseudouridine synthase n=1 Tax=Pelagicoccus sp. SDUM812002 TaxID=3041266 RepID=UPI00280CE357|nr:RluA family pseudouridine synthase [Pelagicoccus sp. SDUM812002]MDQ8186418.1 RluA family pseudouridine synthase [Pelagicoccus sp. SDUM812002]
MIANADILLDEPGFVVANKPSGMLSEGGADREIDLEQFVSTLVGRQVWCCHRLDRLTSGLVVLRKGKRYLKELSSQFESRSVRKEYWLLVDGVWDHRIQKVDSLIAPVGGGVHANVLEGGKSATSTFQLRGVDEVQRISWLRGLLKTGRTHQLRLHTLMSGCPVLGDPVYGKSRADGLFGLHAFRLKMRHPGTGEALDFEADIPENWRPLIAKFEAS